MSILKKRSILKLAATFMLVAMMAGAFTMHSSTAKAAGCDPAAFSQASCDMTVTSTFGGSIAFSNEASVIVAAPIIGANPFTFDTLVKDQSSSTEPGWSLQATSTGLTIGGLGVIPTTPIPLSIDGTITPTVICTDTGSCPTVTTPLTALTPLTTTLQTFASAGTSDSPHGTLATVTTHGSFAFAVTDPRGAYSGKITISLVVAP